MRNEKHFISACGYIKCDIPCASNQTTEDRKTHEIQFHLNLDSTQAFAELIRTGKKRYRQCKCAKNGEIFMTTVDGEVFKYEIITSHHFLRNTSCTHDIIVHQDALMKLLPTTP